MWFSKLVFVPLYCNYCCCAKWYGAEILVRFGMMTEGQNGHDECLGLLVESETWWNKR